MSSRQVLFVDLDNTLISTDLVWESLFGALRQHPASILLIPFWFLQGRPTLKQRLAERFTLDVQTLPYFHEVIEYLRQRRAVGWGLVLATASTKALAVQVVDYLKLFDDCLATESGANFKGATKLAGIRQYCLERGIARRGYAGDSRADLAVWQGVDEVVAVEPAPAVVLALQKLGKPTDIVLQRRPRTERLIKALHLGEWLWNVLVLAAALWPGEPLHSRQWFALTLALVITCAATTAVGLWTDALWAQPDRRDPQRSRLPFAAGELSLAVALIGAPALLAASCGLAGLALPWQFLVLLLNYVIADVAYAIARRYSPFAAIALAPIRGVLRVVAGVAAIGWPILR